MWPSGAPRESPVLPTPSPSPALCPPQQIPTDLRALVEGVRETLGLTRFESVRVNHCAHAYGLVLAGGEGERAWKVVFSADTRPCDQLVEAAKGATVFIHEVRWGPRGGVGGA